MSDFIIIVKPQAQSFQCIHNLRTCSNKKSLPWKKKPQFWTYIPEKDFTREGKEGAAEKRARGGEGKEGRAEQAAGLAAEERRGVSTVDGGAAMDEGGAVA